MDNKSLVIALLCVGCLQPSEPDGGSGSDSGSASPFACSNAGAQDQLSALREWCAWDLEHGYCTTCTYASCDACVDDLKDYGCPNLHACWNTCVDRERGDLDRVELCIDQYCDINGFCG